LTISKIRAIITNIDEKPSKNVDFHQKNEKEVARVEGSEKRLDVFMKKANKVVNPVVGWCIFGGALALAVAIGLIVCL